jgi:hypothetical protein
VQLTDSDQKKSPVVLILGSIGAVGLFLFGFYISKKAYDSAKKIQAEEEAGLTDGIELEEIKDEDQEDLENILPKELETQFIIEPDSDEEIEIDLDEIKIQHSSDTLPEFTEKSTSHVQTDATITPEIFEAESESESESTNFKPENETFEITSQ